MANPHPIYNPQLYEAFGERKSLTHWAEDERCVVCHKTLVGRVQERKWDFLRALTQPPQSNVPKSARRLQPKKKPTPRGLPVTAWGMTKNLSQWAAQTYVPVSCATLWRRIVQKGWPPEKALMLKPSAKLKEPAPSNPWEMSLGEYLRRGLVKEGPYRG